MISPGFRLSLRVTCLQFSVYKKEVQFLSNQIKGLIPTNKGMKRINLPPGVSNSYGVVARREALRRAAAAGALISLSPLAGFGVSTAEAAEEALGKFPKHPQWKFTFVSHVTTNPFWVPLRYGAEDACALLGCSYQWTGSEKSIATEMVNALNTAVSAGVDGIAVALVDPTAFNDPVEKALAASIPVVAYNADAATNGR